MHRYAKFGFTGVLLAAFGLTACSSKEKEAEKKAPAAKEVGGDKGKATPPKEEKAEGTKDKVAEKAEEGEKLDPKADKTPPEHMEQDANATDSVKVHDFKNKLPDDIDKGIIKGKFHKIIGWTDKWGLQAIIFTTTSQTKGDSTSSMLIADFMHREGDAWTSQRQFKASVKDCQFDTVLEAKTGEWSVRDIDKNGLADITFAWTADCTSDVSPNMHKLFIVGHDEKNAEIRKLVLRGNTAVDDGSGEILGGDFKADEAFGKADAAYLEHAKKTWKITSAEKL